MLASALSDVAESDLRDGQTSPPPDAPCSHSDADLQEPIELLLEAAFPCASDPDEVTA